MARFEVTVSQRKTSQDLAYATEICQTFSPHITCAKSYVLFDIVGHRVTRPFFTDFVGKSKNLFAVLKMKSEFPTALYPESGVFLGVWQRTFANMYG